MEVGGTFMDVELFAVGGATLEFDPSRLGIDENVSGNDADVLTIRKDVQ